MTTSRSTASARPSLASIGAAGARALAVAVAGNLLLYLGARAAGAFGALAAGQQGGATVPEIGAIVALSVLAPLTATVLFALLVRFAPRPGTIFLVVAAVVYAAFVAGPLSLDAPIGTTLALEAMHVVVAVPVVLALLKTLTPGAQAATARARSTGLSA